MKTEIITKIKVIYDSICKANAKGRQIKMKTHNLTRSRARNDPINCQIQGFSFCDFENEVRRSSCNFFLFFQPILDFKHSLDAEMSL